MRRSVGKQYTGRARGYQLCLYLGLLGSLGMSSPLTKRLDISGFTKRILSFFSLRAFTTLVVHN
jgi:hypothetical protein